MERVRAFLRALLIYNFIRSFVVKTTNIGELDGLLVVVDIFSMLVVAWVEDDDRRSWPFIGLAVALSEIVRFATTYPLAEAVRHMLRA